MVGELYPLEGGRVSGVMSIRRVVGESWYLEGGRSHFLWWAEEDSCPLEDGRSLESYPLGVMSFRVWSVVWSHFLWRVVESRESCPLVWSGVWTHNY